MRQEEDLPPLPPAPPVEVFEMRPASYTVLFAWLILHALLTGYTLVSRFTGPLEWSIVLLFFYALFVIILNWRRSVSKRLKLLGWAAWIYDLFIANGALMYGIFRASRTINPVEPLDLKMLVPVNDPVYLAVMALSAGFALVIGGLGLMELRAFR